MLNPIYKELCTIRVISPTIVGKDVWTIVQKGTI